MKAVVLIVVMSVLISAVITILALYVSSRIGLTQSGSFNLFEGLEPLAAIIAGSIYGGAIGIVIGIISSTLFITVVQPLDSKVKGIWIIVIIACVIGILECGFFLIDNRPQSLRDMITLPLYLLISGFLTGFIPLFLAHRYLGNYTELFIE